jgi:hypothetical protein
VPYSDVASWGDLLSVSNNARPLKRIVSWVINMIKWYKQLLISFILFAIANLISHQVLYKLFIVPKLEYIKIVPLIWWLICLLPIIITSSIITHWWISYLNLFPLILGGTFASQLYGYFAALTNQPGFLKSWVIKDPFYYWSIILLSTALFYLLLISSTMFLNRLFKMKKAS